MTHVLEPDHAPTPFTADQIRDATDEGKTRRIRIVEADGTTYFRVNTFSDCTDGGALLTRTRFDGDGGPIGEPDASHVTWLDLQRHASFPADRTTIDEVELDGRLGRLACLRYTFADGDEVDVFWFATSMPGMPIRTESRVAGELTVTTEVIA